MCIDLQHRIIDDRRDEHRPGQVTAGTISTPQTGLTYGTDKAFSIAGPRARNTLPSDMKLISSRPTFRNKLKTLF